MSAVCGFATALSAQGASFLDYNPDARAIGVAGASATHDATAFSVWNNGAATVFSDDKFAAGTSFGLWQPSFTNVKQAAVAGYGKISDRWSINAGFRYELYEPIELADDQGIYSGTFTPNGMQAVVGASFRIIPSLAVSASAAFVRSDVGGPAAANAVAFDLGLLYRTGNFRAALVAANLGTSVNYGGATSYSLPSKIDLGVGYGIGQKSAHSLDVSAQGTYLLAESGLRAAAGLRYSFKDMLRVSAGYNYGIGEGLPSFATLGAGVKFFGVALDFAYMLAASGTPMSGTMVINLSYAF